ncbi:hypothetical protein GGX14DRAFT_397379 [Mycena pura]|uniref:Uncharacterized protein n=1 Tax=Mycena pura TaxID=153505 RepID=A0AAD6V8M0_9AGAR|nr:hypothetical protein GGX14DRAFT_397379 [Mycena pura]
MSRVTAQEINRLFGPYRPDWNTNVRHHAILRKALEVHTLEQLILIFGQALDRLRMHNGRLIRLATDALPAAARERIQSYMTVYDIVFFKTGNDYRVRNLAAWPLLQAEEQSFHDWIVVYLGRPRPAWALEALPGLQRVRVAAPAAVLSPARRAIAPFPRVQNPVPRTDALARRVAARVTAPEPATPKRARPPQRALPTPPPSSPAAASGSARPTHMRTFSKRKFLGTIEISDDEDDERPMKRIRFLGTIDLTT